MEDHNLVPTHGIIRQWCEVFGPKTEAPLEGHLGAAIALISAAIGHKLYVQWARNREPCTVNIILEGSSATGRKTTTANTARDLAYEAIDPSDDDAGLRIRTVGHTSDRGLIELVAPTSESEAARWMKTVPPGNLLVWDEFGPMLGEAGTNRKGSDWGGRTRKVLMDFAGGYQYGIRTGQVNRPESRCAVSILATVTRKELEQRISMGLLEDGFMGRFALIPMHANGRRLYAPPEWTRAEMDQVELMVRWLRGLINRREPWGHVFDLMTDGAKDARAEWYDGHKDAIEGLSDELHDEDELAARSAAFGRMQTTAIKLAGVLAVSQLDNPLDDPLTIERHHVVYGQMMVDMMMVEVLQLAAMSGPIADQYVDRVIGFLERRPEQQATRRELARHCKMAGMTARQRWDVIEHVMFQAGIVDIKKQDTSGRPAVVVRLLTPLPAPSGTPEQVTKLGDLPAPSGTPLSPEPQTGSSTGNADIRHFVTPPRVREGQGFLGVNDTETHFVTLSPDIESETDTPPGTKVTKVPEGPNTGSAAQRSSDPEEDDDVPY